MLRGGHGAHGGSERCTAGAVGKRPVFGGGLAQGGREGQVAAEDDAPFTRESVRKSRCDRTHAGNCHDSQRDAGDKYIESAQASAQFACRKTQGQRTATSAGRKRRRQRSVHDCTSTSTRFGAVSIRPERSRTTRSQREATAASSLPTTTS